MLKVAPRRWFSWDYEVRDDQGLVAVVDLARFREAGELTIRGSSYRVYREGLMSGAFLLEENGKVVARAHKPSAFFRSFFVEHAGKQYVLEAQSAFRRRFVLREAERVIGSVYPESVFRRTATVDLPENIPLAVRVFMIWLVIILWKRDSDGAAASTS